MKLKKKILTSCFISLALVGTISTIVAISSINNVSNVDNQVKLNLNDQTTDVNNQQTTIINNNAIVVNELAANHIVASDLSGNSSIFQQMRDIVSNYIIANQTTIFNVLAQPISIGDVIITTPLEYNDAEGSVRVTITIINSKALNNGVAIPQKEFPNILLSGFEKPTTTFVGEINTNVVTIPELANVVASDLDLVNNKPTVAAVEGAIAKYFAQNQARLFKYFLRTPDKNNFQIRGFSNIDDTTGSATIVSLVVTGAKCQVDGKAVQELEFKNIRITGFKKPTTELNLPTNGTRLFKLANLKGLIPSQILNATPVEMENAKQIIISQIVASQNNIFKYLNQPLTVQDVVINGFINPKNDLGSIEITQLQIINNKALVNGRPAGVVSFNNITISGFSIPTTTIINNNITISGLSQDVASVIANDLIVNNQTPQLSSVKQIITTYLATNASSIFSNLVTNSTLEPADIEISLASSDVNTTFNNLKGQLIVNVTINNNKAYENGVAVTNFLVSNPITINGFKQMVPLKINNLAFQFDQIPTEYLKTNRQQLIDWIKQTIITQLNPNMFLNNTISPNQVEVSNLISNNQAGVVSCNIALTGVEYVSTDGTIRQNYTQFIQVSGFLQEALPTEQYWYLILIGVLVGVGLITIITILIIRKRANKYRS